MLQAKFSLPLASIKTAIAHVEIGGPVMLLAADDDLFKGTRCVVVGAPQEVMMLIGAVAGLGFDNLLQVSKI